MTHRTTIWLISSLASVGTAIALQGSGILQNWHEAWAEHFELPLPAWWSTTSYVSLAVAVLLGIGLAWLNSVLRPLFWAILLSLFALLQVATGSWLLAQADLLVMPHLSLLAGLVAVLLPFALTRSKLGIQVDMTEQILTGVLDRKHWHTFMHEVLPQAQRSAVVMQMTLRYAAFSPNAISPPAEQSQEPKPESETTSAPAEDKKTEPELSGSDSPAAAVLRSRKHLLQAGAWVTPFNGRSQLAFFGLIHADREKAIEEALDSALNLQNDPSKSADPENDKRNRCPWKISLIEATLKPVPHNSDGYSTLSWWSPALDDAETYVNLNEEYGTNCILSAEVLNGSGDKVEVRPMDLLAYPDGHRAEIYELLGRPDELSEDEKKRRDIYWRAVILFREGNFEEAHSTLQTALPKEGDDAAVNYYMRRLENYLPPSHGQPARVKSDEELIS